MNKLLNTCGPSCGPFFGFEAFEGFFKTGGFHHFLNFGDGGRANFEVLFDVTVTSAFFEPIGDGKTFG